MIFQLGDLAAEHAGLDGMPSNFHTGDAALTITAAAAAALQGQQTLRELQGRHEAEMAPVGCHIVLGCV